MGLKHLCHDRGMADFLLVVIAAFVAAGIVFGIAVLATGGDPGLAAADPDRRPRTLPRDRPLVEPDVAAVRFDTALRGYRMADVDEVLRRVGYDLGYKGELIRVMEAELTALRDGELEQANELQRMRMVALGRADVSAVGPEQGDLGGAALDERDDADSDGDADPDGDVDSDDGDGPEEDSAAAGDVTPVDAEGSSHEAAATSAEEPGEVGSRRG